MSAQAIAGEAVTTVSLLEQLCRATAQHTSAVGAAIGLMAESGSAGMIASTDDHSAVLDELHHSLGQGPSRDAFTLRRPVLVADLASPEGQAWPIYRAGAGAAESGVGRVFAFPLHVGAAAFGVLSIYTTTAGRLDSDQLAMALTFAEVATEILLDGDAAPLDGSLAAGMEKALTSRTEIYQAQGAVTAHLERQHRVGHRPPPGRLVLHARPARDSAAQSSESRRSRSPWRMPARMRNQMPMDAITRNPSTIATDSQVAVESAGGGVGLGAPATSADASSAASAVPDIRQR